MSNMFTSELQAECH